ncbi:MAG TPA: hypothetical protein VK177_16890 [Flavobacteriales bacterium]|nr:hypothetical protein [Flavobacteriales bacterium]
MSLLKRYVFLGVLLPSICFAFRGKVNSSVLIESTTAMDRPDTIVQQDSQTKIFNWNDTSFSKGSKRIIKFYYPKDGPCTTYPCCLDCNRKFDSLSSMHCINKYVYDTILHFLIENKKAKIRLDFHMDLRYNAKFSDRLSNQYATGCMKEFKRLKADTLRIRTVGWGSTKPIISLETISKETDKKKRNDLHRVNQRVEIIIE